MTQQDIYEQLTNIQQWYGEQTGLLSEGLSNVRDAIKLHEYWTDKAQAERLPEYCDDTFFSATGEVKDRIYLALERYCALGYDPMGQLVRWSDLSEGERFRMVGQIEFTKSGNIGVSNTHPDFIPYRNLDLLMPVEDHE